MGHLPKDFYDNPEDFELEIDAISEKIAKESEAALSKFVLENAVIESNVINPLNREFTIHDYPYHKKNLFDLRHTGDINYKPDLEFFDMVVIIKGIDERLEYTHYIMFFTGPIGSAVTLTNCVRDLVMLNRFNNRHAHGMNRYRIKEKIGKDIGPWIRRIIQEQMEQSHPENIAKETIQ